MKIWGIYFFIEEEVINMLWIVRDKDIGKVYLEEYCKILVFDGLFFFIDFFEFIDECFW